MCLLAMSYRAHPGYDLVLITNRDEYFERPAEEAHFWKDSPDLLAGRDVKSGGTWMGISRTGKFGLITNFRDPTRHRSDALSRGTLVSDFLKSSDSVSEYLKRVSSESFRYNDFNLMLGTREQILYFSSVERRTAELRHGIYGMSNHLLETPWPKVLRAKSRLNEILSSSVGVLSKETLFSVLAESQTAADRDLPETGVGLERERALSSIFITVPGYGTRCSTVLLIDSQGKVTFSERSYSADRKTSRTVDFRFEIKSDRLETGTDRTQA